MSDLRLEPKPDWPDRCRWALDFNAQMLHDHDYPVRSGLDWNNAEDQDLLDQVNADVSIEEIARRHQRTRTSVAMRHRILVWRLEESLLR